MKQTVEKLKGILQEELSIYESLHKLAQEKKKLLLEKFSTDLNEIVKREELNIQRLIDLESPRCECVEKITGDSKSNLDAAVEAISESDGKSDIWMIGSKLKDTVASIAELNQENQNLLEQALELTQYSIKLFTRVPGDVTYSAKGQQAGKRSGISLIDRKA